MKSRASTYSTVGDEVRVYDNQKNFIGIYQLQENQVLKPYKLFTVNTTKSIPQRLAVSEEKMEYITSSDFHFKNTAVALGKFEGIHRGHQLLMDSKKKTGSFMDFKALYLHPDRPTRLTLTGDTEYKQIYTREKKILEKRGIDILIEHPFTKEFAALLGRFIREVLVEKVGAKVIVVGTDFHFGRTAPVF